LIDWLLRETKNPNARNIEGKNNLLKKYLNSPLPSINQPLKFNSTKEPIIHGELEIILRNEGLLRAAGGVPSSGKSVDYANTCSASGVPVPPDWGD
jgi:hypothetical protein